MNKRILIILLLTFSFGLAKGQEQFVGNSFVNKSPRPNKSPDMEGTDLYQILSLLEDGRFIMTTFVEEKNEFGCVVIKGTWKVKNELLLLENENNKIDIGYMKLQNDELQFVKENGAYYDDEYSKSMIFKKASR